MAALEAGELGLPTQDQMMRAIAAQREAVTRLYPDSPRYALELDPRVYREGLAREMRRARKDMRLRRKLVRQSQEIQTERA